MMLGDEGMPRKDVVPGTNVVLELESIGNSVRSLAGVESLGVLVVGKL
jgi:hypothetical protein